MIDDNHKFIDDVKILQTEITNPAPSILPGSVQLLEELRH